VNFEPTLKERVPAALEKRFRRLFSAHWARLPCDRDSLDLPITRLRRNKATLSNALCCSVPHSCLCTGGFVQFERLSVYRSRIRPIVLIHLHKILDWAGADEMFAEVFRECSADFGHSEYLDFL